MTADFEIDGIVGGENLASKFKPTDEGVWEIILAKPLGQLEKANLTVSVRDNQGNETKIVRTFSVGGGKLAGKSERSVAP